MDYTQAITLALQGVTALSQLIIQLKAQANMSDEALLSMAEQQDKQTRDQIAAFLKTL